MADSVRDVAVEFRHLRAFVAIAEEGNITRAARREHLAQQALSQQVRQLEALLGVPLLVRRPRGVELTAAGAALVPEARRLLAGRERAVERVHAAARGESGVVRLAFTFATAQDTLPTLAEAVRARLPHVKLVAREIFGGDLDAALREGRFDVGLAPRVPLGAGMEAAPVRRERLVAALAADHPLAGAAELELERLRDEALELWPADMAPGFHDAVLATCRAAGFEPRVDEAAGGSTVWGRIAEGLGFGLVAGSLARQVPSGVRLVPLAGAGGQLTIDAVWRPDAASPPVERFVALALAVGAERGW